MFRVIFAAIAVALTALWLFVWRAPLGVAEWPLAPHKSWPVGAWFLTVAILVIFGGAAALSVYDRFKRAKKRKEQTNSTITALVCLAVIGLLWPWSLLGPGQDKNQQPSTKLMLEGRFNIIASMWSDTATEYFGAAYSFDDARAYTRTYAATQQNPTSRAQAHVATHPPGAVLWFYGVRKITESSPALQNGLEALAQTVTGQTQAESVDLAGQVRATATRIAHETDPTPFPDPAPLPPSAIASALLAAILLGLSLVAALPAVYGLAALGGGAGAERRGLLAAALWVLAPTTNLFAFTLDALVACGAAWTLYFAALAWNRSEFKIAGFAPTSNRDEEQIQPPNESTKPTAKAIAPKNAEDRLEVGASPVHSNSKPADFWWIASGIALALTTFLSIGALAVGAILVVALAIYRPRGAARALLFSVGAFVTVWALLSWWGGFNPLQIALNAGAAHRFATLETRGYWPWVLLNLAVWMPFAGWPIVALLAGGVKLYKESVRPASQSAKFPATGFCLGVATIGVLLLLCLSGNVRGEVERLWLFSLAPLCVVAVCDDAISWRYWAPLLGLQALQTLLMAATLAPLVRPF